MAHHSETRDQRIARILKGANENHKPKFTWKGTLMVFGIWMFVLLIVMVMASRHMGGGGGVSYVHCC